HEQKQLSESTDHAQLYADAALAAIRDFDQTSLETTLDNATRELGYSGLLERVIIPVIQRVGEDWHSGHLTAAGEHASTSFIKEYLTNSVRAFAISENAPVLVVTTPAGQLHELGVFIASCLARKEGWKIIYLGPSLPADEIAGAADRVDADAILLSITYPIDDPMLGYELKRLRKLAPEGIPVLVGGMGITNYAEVLKSIGAMTIPTLTDVSQSLHDVRASRVAG
ncbi:MAG: cobalamin B12-binding domain-containing protein, partial [Verrucomicrobiae bacterium]|nr:cobalamin B12-binding domain-containing protein [Verrucomicrobiae bacterium]NNJ86392.1 cobalamin B12-binding domain-containing protein [Akkermansiaceae bacterium]